MKTLGTRIKRLRESKSMTQDELAQKMGYKSRSSINKIELDLSDLPQSKISLLILVVPFRAYASQRFIKRTAL